MSSDELYEELWQRIAEVRDASPRKVNDADTDDIVTAVVDAFAIHLEARANRFPPGPIREALLSEAKTLRSAK